MKLALISRIDDRRAVEFTAQLRQMLEGEGFTIVYDQSSAAIQPRERGPRPIEVDADMMVIVGGDGTVLRTVQMMKKQIPVIGINWGEVGFLTDLEPEDALPFFRMIKDGFTILTHCNTGSLATAAYGTALGVIKMAHEQGKKVNVYATETRPLLQGARLTTWELLKENIPVTLITDRMAGYFMSQGAIDCVIVGADRIAANGDVANKIGTYSLAVLATENGIPFYVAAPLSTIDFSLSSGADIPIEERNPEEVTHIQGVRIAPAKVKAANPAFDVTPHCYISAIITEKGVAKEPYVERLKALQ